MQNFATISSTSSTFV